MSESEHTKIREALGAYALNAVDPEERELLEAHLTGCPSCRAEVMGHLEVAAMLGHSNAEAPSGLWNRISEKLGEEDVATRSFVVKRRWPLWGGWNWVALGAASAAVIIAGVLAFRLADVERRLDRVSDQAAQISNGEEAFLNPDSTKVVLRSAEDRSLFVQMVLLPDGSGYVIDDSLHRLEDNRTYQLWGIVADQAISVGILGPDPGEFAFMLASDVKAFAITEETAGGVASSDNQPVVFGRVSR